MRHLIVAVGLLSVVLVARADAQTVVAAPPHTANFDGFIVTEGDISDRPYAELGVVTAKAGKFSWVSRNPDRSDIDTKLRLRTLKMGADAVVRVHYTPTGASVMSWGGIKGEGVAIKYQAAAPAPAPVPTQPH
jgi:hypothetical protein